MLDTETEIFTLLYALGEAIRLKDWTLARLTWDRLLLMHRPLVESHPHVATVLRNQEAMVYLHSNSIH